MKEFLSFLFLFVFLIYGANGSATPPLPDVKTRVKIIDALAAEMLRLDNEAIYVRRNRPTPWDQTVGGLLADAAMASDWTQFLNVFARLDHTYPNLHAHSKVGEQYASQQYNKIDFKVGFTYDEYDETSGKFVISRVDKDANIPTDKTLDLYEELIAINGQPLTKWQQDNLEFCKFSLPQQCHRLLYHNLRKGVLSWKPDQPLIFSVRAGRKSFDFQVELKNYQEPAKNPNEEYCSTEKNRYTNTYKLVYSGNRACVYQEQHEPGVAVLRITSFDYSNLKSNEPINSVEAEVAALYQWWEKNAYWNQLIIDVINNRGGAEPTEYFKILLKDDFQQIFVNYKKIKELENPKIRESIFWGSKAQELWFQGLISSGKWNQLVEGEQTSAVPMFCPDANRDCTQGLFKPMPHPFYGRISVLLDQWCVSACDNFVHTLQERVASKVKFFGQPNAADSAYSRLAIHVYLDPTATDGFRLEVTPADAKPGKDVLVTQIVVVSQTVDSFGKILAGAPVTLEAFIEKSAHDTGNWHRDVLDLAKYY